MTAKRPKPGTKEFDDWVKERTKSAVDELFKKGAADFDERGTIFGNDESIKSSDADAFPDEMEERQSKTKPRPVSKPKK